MLTKSMEVNYYERNMTGLTDFRRPVYCILGLPFDAVSRKQVTDQIAKSVATSTPCVMSTPNLNFLVTSIGDAEFRDTVINSDLSVADGMPLVWIAWLLGTPVRERVAGSDIVEDLMHGAGGKLKAFFFGGQDGFARRASECLNHLSGEMRSVGDLSPGFGSIEEMSRPEMIEQINNSGADFLLVGLPASKGQRWIKKNRDKLKVPVISSLGAVINFVAGTVERAPVFFRKTGLEWLWRIKEEPPLWRRYAKDGLTLMALLFTRVLPCMGYRAFRLMVHSPLPAKVMVELVNASLEPQTKQDCSSRALISGNWSDTDLPALRTAFEQLTLNPGNIEIDIAHLGWVDAGFVGLLMLLYGHQKKLGRGFIVSPPDQRLTRMFRFYCADFLLKGTATPMSF